MSDVNEDLGLPEGQRPTDPTAQRSTTFLVGEVSSGIPVALTARGTVSTVRTTPSSLSSSLSSTEEGSIPCPASVPVANPNFASSGRDDGDGGCSSGSAKTWLTGGRNRQRTTNEWIYVREERSNDALEARSKVVDREREIGWLVHPRSTPWSTAEKIGCTPNKIAFFYGHRRFTIRKVFTATKMWIKHNPKNGVVHILKNAIESCSRDVM